MRLPEADYVQEVRRGELVPLPQAGLVAPCVGAGAICVLFPLVRPSDSLVPPFEFRQSLQLSLGQLIVWMLEDLPQGFRVDVELLPHLTGEPPVPAEIFVGEPVRAHGVVDAFEPVFVGVEEALA